jgi:hypothetical protein
MLFLQIYIMLFLKLVSDIHFFKLVMTTCYHKVIKFTPIDADSACITTK